MAVIKKKIQKSTTWNVVSTAVYEFNNSVNVYLKMAINVGYMSACTFVYLLYACTCRYAKRNSILKMFNIFFSSVLFASFMLILVISVNAKIPLYN